MSFSEDQIDRLASSYALLEPRLDTLVENFYDRLFTTAPGVRSMFPDDMSTQRSHLASALRLVAKNIANIDSLAEPLRAMGARHIGYGAQEAHYPVVRDTLVASMAEVADDAWTDRIGADWKAALNAVAGFMIEGAHSAQPGRSEAA